VLITSHDQAFLDNVVDETILIRKSSLEYFDGTPQAREVQEDKERRSKVKLQAALDKKKTHIEQSISQGRDQAVKTGDENR
jgi:ATP-binding cassette subfamily F protein 3